MKMIYEADKLSREVRTKRLIELDLGLREAAQEIGISFATLCRIENKKKPDIEVLASICDWIEQPMGIFFSPNDKPENNPATKTKKKK